YWISVCMCTSYNRFLLCLIACISGGTDIFDLSPLALLCYLGLYPCDWCYASPYPRGGGLGVQLEIGLQNPDRSSQA
ncbi:hypothetical protein BD779DRAFT_1569002, partial [Infundibulicybe gibba]